MSRVRQAADAGATLVELMVALALFALIAVAGFTLVDSILRVRERTDGRLERLAALQRAMHVMTADFEQAAPGPLSFVDEAVVFRRASGPGRSAVVVRYEEEDDALVRTVGAAPQRLLTGVEGLRWEFYTPPAGWAPTPARPGEDGRPPPRPSAVALTVTVASIDGGPSGRLRRVVALPDQP